MIQMSRDGSKPRSNAMKRPSGDHAGDMSSSSVLVSARGRPPRLSMTQMSRLAPAAPEYAIFVPSGDHRGYSSMPLVSRVGFEPSASITQSLRWPAPRSEANTIFLPSGDHEGDQSLAESRVRLRRWLPSASAR
jgi:hypothetical protein